MRYFLKILLMLSIVFGSTKICFSRETSAKDFEDFLTLKLALDELDHGLVALNSPVIPENFDYLLKLISIPGREPGEFCYEIDLSEERTTRKVTLHFKISKNGAPASEVRKFLETGKSDSDLKLVRIVILLHSF